VSERIHIQFVRILIFLAMSLLTLGFVQDKFVSNTLNRGFLIGLAVIGYQYQLVENITQLSPDLMVNCLVISFFVNRASVQMTFTVNSRLSGMQHLK